MAGQAQSGLPAPPPLRDGRFGVVQTYDSPREATAVGAGWTRVLFLWHQVQPRNANEWNPFFFQDGIMEEELAAGRELVGLLAGTAPWASESGDARAVPDGLYLPYNDPDNTWGRFVTTVAERYEGKIDRWIVWNEPDVWDSTHPGKAWNGSLEDYVQLLRVAYQAAKAANPNAQIHLAATTYWWDVQYGRPLYFARLLDALKNDPDAARNNYYFDVASLHLYFKPEQVYDITRLYRTLLNERGFGDKPLWVNETNAPPSEDPQHPAPGLRFPVSLEEQSNFIIQAWAMGLAAGAERMALYKMRDEPTLLPGVEPYGMVRLDYSPRPAFHAYRTLVTYLSDYEDATLYRLRSLRRVVVQRGDLGRTTVVWSMALRAETYRIPASSTQALLVDPYGPTTVIRPVNGVYTLILPPSRGGDIGGTPFMIVEGAGMEVRLPRPQGAEYTAQQAVATATPTLPPGVTPTAVPTTPDWAIGGGWFFTQAANGPGGYSVTDDAQANFWTEFQRMGGLQTVGYPISQRYIYDGFVTQAFQKLVLQWRPDAGAAWPVNIFDELSDAGRDQVLWERYQTPPPLVGATFDPPNADFETIVAHRQALLDSYPAIRGRYFDTANPLTVFGLPTSRGMDVGNHIAIRTQRAVFQQWTENVPWARAGEVTIANGGSIAQNLGWLPGDALVPEPAER